MLNAADYPKDKYAAYWEVVPPAAPNGNCIVRIYERGTGKGCVAEKEMPPADANGFIRAAMAAYRKEEA